MELNRFDINGSERFNEAFQAPRHDAREILFSRARLKEEWLVRRQRRKPEPALKVHQQRLCHCKSIHGRLIWAEVTVDFAWSSARSEHVVEVVAGLEITPKLEKFWIIGFLNDGFKPAKTAVICPLHSVTEPPAAVAFEVCPRNGGACFRNINLTLRRMPADDFGGRCHLQITPLHYLLRQVL